VREKEDTVEVKRRKMKRKKIKEMEKEEARKIGKKKNKLFIF
jgi:hypothetical protein